MNYRQPNDPDLNAPEKLRAALARSQARCVIVPSTVDDAVLRAAREHLKPATSRTTDQPTPTVAVHSLWAELCAGVAELLGERRLTLVSATMVTMVAAGMLVWWTVHPHAAVRLGDLNADGQVDILDAFALALEIQPGQSPGPQFDLNGDGVVDERDVQILAARAVSLETGGHS